MTVAALPERLLRLHRYRVLQLCERLGLDPSSVPFWPTRFSLSL